MTNVATFKKVTADYGVLEITDGTKLVGIPQVITKVALNAKVVSSQSEKELAQARLAILEA